MNRAYDYYADLVEKEKAEDEEIKKLKTDGRKPIVQDKETK